MLYVCIWSYPPERRNEIQARFKETGGPPPEGVKMIGRWHSLGGGKGVCVAETDDAVALAKWSQEWSDIMSMDIYPALDDENIGKVIS